MSWAQCKQCQEVQQQNSPIMSGGQQDSTTYSEAVRTAQWWRENAWVLQQSQKIARKPEKSMIGNIKLLSDMCPTGTDHLV